MKTITAGRLAALLLCAAGASVQAQPVYHGTYLERTKSWGSATADYNRDGHQDIFITGHDSTDRIWYWTPTGYVPSTQVFPAVDRHDCDAADFNQDGLLDLFCTIGGELGSSLDKKNELWIQDASGHFNAQLNHGAEDPYGRGRIPLWFDFNHDGYPDLYLSNFATPRKDGQPNINHVFINNAGQGFVEVITQATGDRGSQCVNKGDVNHDGWDDLVICRERDAGHIYLSNQAGDFIDLATPAIAGEWQDAKFADMNADGLDDLVLLVAHSNLFQIWFNSGSSPYYDKVSFQDVLPSRPESLTIGDFNHDGYKDIYVVLQDPKCPTSLKDVAPDVVYWGGPGNTWVRETMPQQYAGCGHLADTVDGDKVVLENGAPAWKGPNFIIDWTK